MRPLSALILNEARGLATVWLFHYAQPSPAVAALTAAMGLALMWALVWRDLVKPELIARHQAQLLAYGRGGGLQPCPTFAGPRIDWWAALGLALMGLSASFVLGLIVLAGRALL